MFTCPELIERFNIYAAQQKKWLPPDYGKKTYSNMTAEEKAAAEKEKELEDKKPKFTDTTGGSAGGGGEKYVPPKIF